MVRLHEPESDAFSEAAGDMDSDNIPDLLDPDDDGDGFGAGDALSCQPWGACFSHRVSTVLTVSVKGGDDYKVEVTATK